MTRQQQQCDRFDKKLVVVRGSRSKSAHMHAYIPHMHAYTHTNARSSSAVCCLPSTIEKCHKNCLYAALLYFVFVILPLFPPTIFLISFYVLFLFNFCFPPTLFHCFTFRLYCLHFLLILLLY